MNRRPIEHPGACAGFIVATATFIGIGGAIFGSGPVVVGCVLVIILATVEW